MLVRNWRPVADEFARVAAKHGDPADARLSAVRQAGLAAWQAWGHRRAGRRLRAAGVYLASGVRYRSRGNLARAAGTLLGERALIAAGRYRRGGTATGPPPTPRWVSQSL